MSEPKAAKFKKLKELGFKKPKGILGTIYGVVEGLLLADLPEIAADDAFTVGATLQEIQDRMCELEITMCPEDAWAILKGEITTEKHLLFDINGIINSQKVEEVKDGSQKDL